MHLQRERATCSTWAMSDSYWIARLRTAASRTSSNSGSDAGEQRAGEEHPLAQAGLGDLDPVEVAELEHRLEHHRGGEDDVAATGLDPGHRAALVDAGSAASVSTSSRSIVGRDHEALDAEVDRSPSRALRGGGEVADGAADPDEPRARDCSSQSSPSSALAHVGADALRDPSSWPVRSPGRNCSVRRTAPSGNDAILPRVAVPDLDSCMLPPPRSSTTPSVSVVVLTAAT